MSGVKKIKNHDEIVELHALLAHGPAVVYTCEPWGNYPATFISENVEEQMGYKPEDFLRDSDFWASKIHPDDSARIFEQLPNLFANGHHVHEYRFLHKDGTYRWMRDELKLTFDGNENPTLIIGCWLDITKSKEVEFAQKRSEKRFEDFANSASDWFWEMGPDLRFTYFSESIKDVIDAGIDIDSFLGKTRLEIASDINENREKWRKHTQDMKARKPIRDFRYNHIAPDGETVYFSIDGNPVYDEQGSFRGYRGAGHNITEKMLAEKELKQQRDHLEELVAQLEESRQETVETSERISGILSSIHDAFFAVDMDWRLTYANLQAEAIFEHPIEEIKGQVLWDLIPEFASAFYKPLIKSINDQEPNSVEGYYPPLQCWFDMRAYPTKDGVSIYLLDDTVKHEAEAELIAHRNHLEMLVVERTLEVSEKAKQLELALKREKEYSALQQKFVSMVSHEFRTPLTIIDGAAQRLIRRKGKLDADELETRANRVRSAVTRMIGMIDTTLYASRLDAGKIDLKIVPCDIKALVLDICERQSEISPSHQIKATLDDLPGEIYADLRLLDQVFTNLLSNAIKYSPDSPLIEVRGWGDGDNALISITDQGLGIAADDLPHMFGRYFRAKTAEGIKGTGIGLSVVKEFVQLHGGSIGVDSLEDEGSTFTVRLPIGGAGQ